MQEFLFKYYLWIKVFHLFFVFAWMAGIFYLPRLLAYHVDAKHTEMKQTFEIMEKRLFFIIMQPGMFLSLAAGLFLAMLPGTWTSPWFHMKLTAVVALIAYHTFLNRCRKGLLLGHCAYSSRFFRIMNEIPSVILLIILIAVVVRPF